MWFFSFWALNKNDGLPFSRKNVGKAQKFYKQFLGNCGYPEACELSVNLRYKNASNNGPFRAVRKVSFFSVSCPVMWTSVFSHWAGNLATHLSRWRLLWFPGLWSDPPSSCFEVHQHVYYGHGQGWQDQETAGNNSAASKLSSEYGDSVQGTLWGGGDTTGGGGGVDTTLCRGLCSHHFPPYRLYPEIKHRKTSGNMCMNQNLSHLVHFTQQKGTAFVLNSSVLG